MAPLTVTTNALPAADATGVARWNARAWLALCLAVWAVSLTVQLVYGMAVSPDSASYLEAARSIRDGRGFAIGQFAGVGDERWQPLRLWPPGYPIAVAAAMTLGLPDVAAGQAVAGIGAVVFLILAYRVCAQWLPPPVAALALSVFAAMPAFGRLSGLSWSDAPYLALATGSLVCVLEGWRGESRALAWFTAAGVLAGIGWSFRNVAVALIPVFGIFVLLETARTRRVPFAQGVAWVGGWIVGAGWLLVRNLVVFGTISPYALPPSEKGLVDNLRDLSRVVLHDFSTLRWPNGTVALAVLVVVALSMLAAAVWSVRAYGVRAMGDSPSWRAAWLFAAFGAVHLAAVVAARTTYRWGENINARHLSPVYWLGWAAVAVVLLVLLERVTRSRLQGVVATSVLLATLAAVQLRANVVETRADLAAGYSGLTRLDVSDLAAQVPDGQIVLCDTSLLSGALKSFGRVNARRLAWAANDPDPVIAPAEAVTMEGIQQAGRRGGLWGMVLADPARGANGIFGAAVQAVVADPARYGFTRTAGPGKVVVLRWAGPGGV